MDDPYGQQSYERPRLSKLALASFVCSMSGIVAACPGILLAALVLRSLGMGVTAAAGSLIFGALGMVLGIAGVIVIGVSQRPTRGRGLAVAGLVIGLLWTVLLTAIGVGGTQLYSMSSQSHGQLLAAVDKADAASVRAELSPTVRDDLTDERLATFRAAVISKLGRPKGPPPGLMGLLDGYLEIGPVIESVLGAVPREDAIPLPFDFEQGTGLVVLIFEEDKVSGPAVFRGAVTNVGVATSKGEVVWLFDPKPPAGSSGVSPGGGAESPPPGDGG